jgi:phage-related protein
MSTLAKLLVTLGLDSKEFDSGIEAASQKSSALGNAVKAAAGVAAVGAVAVGASIGKAAYEGLQFNNTMEMVSAQLNAFTKDGAKSAAILDMIKQRAASTPFAFEDMAKAATALLPASKASGIALEELIKKAEILGASNPAAGLEGAAFSLKEALSGDFTSIVERFNLPRQRLKELKEQGVPALEAVGIAMKELGLDADLVTNLANTATGRWSTFKDTMVGVSATITKPLFDVLSGGLAGVNDWLSSNQPLIDQFAASLAGGVQFAINGVVGGITALVGVIKPLSNYFATVVEEGQPLNAWLTQLSPTMASVAYAIGTVVGAFSEASWFAGSFTEQIGATIDTLMGVTDTVGPLQALGAQINSIFVNLPTLLASVLTSLGALDFAAIFEPLIASAQARINTLIDIVSGVFAVISNVITQYGSQIAASTEAAFSAVLNTAVAVFAGVNDVITAVLGQVAVFIQANGQDIANFVAQTWLQIADIVKLAMDLINATVVPILQGIGAFIQAHSAEIQAVLSAAWTVIKTIITTALDLIKTVITVALQAINGDWSGAWNTIQQFSARFVTALLQVFKAGLDMLKNEFILLVDAIKAIFNGLTGNAKNIGTDIINGILNGLKSAGSSIISYLTGLAGDALGAAKAALHIGSPSKLFADQVGVPIILGMVQGMEKAYPQALKWLKGNLGKKLTDYLNTMSGFARGNLDIFKSLRELEKFDPFKDLESKRKAYEDAQKHSIATNEHLAEVQQKINELQASGKLKEGFVNDELNNLLKERQELLDQQIAGTKTLSDLGSDLSNLVNQSEEQKKAITGIAEEARKAYQLAQDQALELMKTDAQGALKFFNERKKQIEELAQLQKERALATDPDEQRALDTQIALLKAAQDAEQSAMKAEININYPGGGDKQSNANILKILQDALRANGYDVSILTRMG